MQSSLCRLCQVSERGRLVRVTARSDDEVRRELYELSDKFEADAAGSSRDMRTMLVSLKE